MDRMSSGNTGTGFSLIELMIVLVVIAATLSVGSPLFQDLLHSNRLRAETARFLGAINLARSEAIRRNYPVSICASEMSVTGEATCSGKYVDGWIVFANRAKDRVVDPEQDEVIEVFEAMPQGYSLTNRNGTILVSELINYLPDGSSHRNRTLLFCAPPNVRIDSLSIVLNIVGRARLAGGWGKCPVA